MATRGGGGWQHDSAEPGVLADHHPRRRREPAVGQGLVAPAEFDMNPRLVRRRKRISGGQYQRGERRAQRPQQRQVMATNQLYGLGGHQLQARIGEQRGGEHPAQAEPGDHQRRPTPHSATGGQGKDQQEPRGDGQVQRSLARRMVDSRGLQVSPLKMLPALPEQARKCHADSSHQPQSNPHSDL